MSTNKNQSPAGRPSEYSNTIIQQYIRAAKEKLEREKADATPRTMRSDNSPEASDKAHYPVQAGNTRFPQAPAQALLPTRQDLPSQQQHQATGPQWQARSDNHGAIPSSRRSSSEYEAYTTDHGSSAHQQNISYPSLFPGSEGRQQYTSSPPSPYRPPHHRRASSNLYHHGHAIQTIPEDRESQTLSSLYAASSQARSSHAATNSQDLEQEDGHEDEAMVHDAGRGLVREASVGRAHRATLTQIGTSESWSRRTSRQSVPPNDSALPGIAPHEPAPMPSITLLSPHIHSPNSSGDCAFASGTGYISPSMSTFSDDFSNHESPVSVRHLRPSPGLRANLTEPTEQRQSSRPFTADSANSSGSFRLVKEAGPPKSKLSERVGSKKPEPLKLELVKQAEMRGSLTSLPDLIKRALRLASNLEMGKTASRLGTDWIFESEGEKKAGNVRSRHSLGSMINSFPSTPNKGLGPYSIMPKSAGLQSVLRRSFTPHKALDGAPIVDEKTQTRRRRKCCGMPVWVFLLTLLTIILLICAAVLIPICLIVIPNSNRDANCVLTTIGDAANVQVGSTIPDLLKNANSSFGIPLDSEVIYQVFQNAKLSCTEENALVSFNTVNKRSTDRAHNQAFQYVAVGKQSSNIFESALGVAPTPVPAHFMHTHNHNINIIALAPRQQRQQQKRSQQSTSAVLTTTATPTTAAGAATSNGIVFAMSSTTPTSTTPATSSSSATNPTASSSSSSSSASFTTTATTASASASASTNDNNLPFTPSILSLTFARTALLYILQQTQSVSATQTAQNNLAAFFANPAAQGGTEGARSVGAGGGWMVDLVDGRVVGPAGGSGVGAYNETGTG